MKTPSDKGGFADRLGARDPAGPGEPIGHEETLFRQGGMHVASSKLMIGAVYAVLFLLAFGAFQWQQHAHTVTRSLLWGSVSLYILLWFLVWFLRHIGRRLVQLVDQDVVTSQRWRRQDRLITKAGVVVFVFNGLLLYRAFTLTDPLQAARDATLTLWAAVFFLFWYPLGMASLAARPRGTTDPSLDAHPSC